MASTWAPVRTGLERVVFLDDESGPRPLYELRVDLEGGPVSGQWATLFESSPITKVGDSSMKDSDPVLCDSAVTWKVSQPALPHAERLIRRRIEWANEQFHAERLTQDSELQGEREIRGVQLFLETHRHRREDQPPRAAPAPEAHHVAELWAI